MADAASEALHYEIRRLRDVVERQYLELTWQQSELRSRSAKASIVRFSAGPLAKTNLTGNAGMLREVPSLPPQDVWPTGAVPKAALIPNCGFASYALANAQMAAIGIAVCGLNEDQVEHITAMVEERLQRARNFRPVFLMDIARTEIFRRRGFSYEYLATCNDKDKRLARRLQDFTAARVEFLKRKWGLSGIIHFGTRPIDVESFTSGAVRHRSQHAINTAVDGLVLQSAKRVA
jgi:hypothetical protein